MILFAASIQFVRSTKNRNRKELEEDENSHRTRKDYCYECDHNTWCKCKKCKLIGHLKMKSCHFKWSIVGEVNFCKHSYLLGLLSFLFFSCAKYKRYSQQLEGVMEVSQNDMIYITVLFLQPFPSFSLNLCFGSKIWKA